MDELADVFEVALVAGTTAELTGSSAGMDFCAAAPLQVPAADLVAASGIEAGQLPGRRFALSGSGWRSVDGLVR